MGLKKLMEKVAGYFRIEPGELRTKSRVSRVARARTTLYCLEVRKLGIRYATQAEELNISPSGVSRVVEHGQGIVRERYIEERILKSQYFTVVIPLFH